MQLHTQKMGLCVIYSLGQQPLKLDLIYLLDRTTQAETYYNEFLVSMLMRFYYASYWRCRVQKEKFGFLYSRLLYALYVDRMKTRNCANFAKYPCSCSARLLTTKTQKKKDVECEEERKDSRYPWMMLLLPSSLHRWDDGIWNTDIDLSCFDKIQGVPTNS